MNFEGLEQFRYENTRAVMESMTKIATDEKIDIKDRMAAAKIVDGMSDSIIKAYLMSTTTQVLDDTSRDLRKQLKKLDD